MKLRILDIFLEVFILYWSFGALNGKFFIAALERKLSQREPRQELVSRGIMPGS